MRLSSFLLLLFSVTARRQQPGAARPLFVVAVVSNANLAGSEMGRGCSDPMTFALMSQAGLPPSIRQQPFKDSTGC